MPRFRRLTGITDPFVVGDFSQRITKQASPAAGAGFTHLVPSGTFERMMALTFTYTSSAAVATRAPRLQVLDQDANIVAEVVAVSTQAASIVRRYSYVRGVTSQTVTVTSLPISAPDFFVPGGWTWSVSAIAIDVADTFTAIVWYMDEIPSGQADYGTGEEDIRDAPYGAGVWRDDA